MSKPCSTEVAATLQRQLGPGRCKVAGVGDQHQGTGNPAETPFNLVLELRP
jgi:hypothetical protein